MTVQANGVLLVLGADGRFTGTVSLDEGANPLIVTASDAAGNSAVEMLSVTRDTKAPDLTVTAPADGTETAEETVTVSGTATDDLTEVSVTVNGIGVSLDPAGAFSTAVPLVEGPNPITVEAVDEAGNPASASLTVRRRCGSSLRTMRRVSSRP